MCSLKGIQIGASVIAFFFRYSISVLDWFTRSSRYWVDYKDRSRKMVQNNKMFEIAVLEIASTKHRELLTDNTRDSKFVQNGRSFR